MPEHRAAAVPPVPSAGQFLLAAWLGVAGILVTLVGIESAFFDLDRHAIPKETVVHLAALVAGIVALRRNRLPWDRLDYILLAFLGVSTLSWLLSLNHWLGFRPLALSCSSVVLYWAARTLSPSPRRFLLALLGLSVALGGFTALAQAYGFDFGVLAQNRTPGGTFGNRNFMAHVMALGLPLLFAGSLTARSRAARAGAGFSIMIVSAAILLSRSRAAWLAVAAGGGLFVMLVAATPRLRLLLDLHDRRRWRWPAATLFAGVVGALTLPNTLNWTSDTPYLESLQGILDYRGGSGRGRLIQYRTSLRLVPEDPVLGVGPGNWMVHYPRVTLPGDPSFAGADPIPTNPWPSSDWVALLVERGSVSVLLLLAAIGCYGLGIYRRRQLHPLRGPVAAAVGLSALTVSLFDVHLLQPVPALLVPLMLGALGPDQAGVPLSIGGPPSPAALARPWQTRVTALVLLLVALGGVRTIATWGAIARMGPGRSPARARAALAIDPWNYRLLLFIAQREDCGSTDGIRRRLGALLPHHPAVRELGIRCGDGNT